MRNDPVPEVGQGDRFSMDSDVIASSGWGTLDFILLSSLSFYFLSSDLCLHNLNYSLLKDTNPFSVSQVTFSI